MATPISKSIVSDDINILKLFMGLRRTGPISEAFAQIFLLLSQLGERSVKEYCIEVLGYSNRQFNSAFTLAERTILDGAWDPMQLDITQLYKLLQRVCGLASLGDDVWHTSGDTIENYLYEIKKERNELAHEGVQIDDAQLNVKYTTLENIIEKLFNKISERLYAPGNATEEYKSVTILSLRDIYAAKVVTPQTLDDCRALLKEAKEEELTRVILLARRELYHRYQNLKSASPITWASHFSQDIMDINQLFTELELSDSNTPVTLEEMLSLSSIVILQGLPGAGKSAVVRFFANSWSRSSRKYKSLSQKDILLLIQCRYVTCDDLVSFLKDEILTDSLEFVEHDDVVSLLKGAELYICVDGYDEAGSKAKDLLQQMLKLFPEAHFLLTTRPEFTDDLKIEAHRFSNVNTIPVINILGFNENNRKEYVKKVFKHLKEGLQTVGVTSNVNQNTSSMDIENPTNQESLEAFHKFLNNKEGILGTLTRLPLTLAFLVILWVDDAENITGATTATQIYHQLLELMIRKLVDRLRQRPGERRTSDILRRKCRKWVIELGKEAWTALKANKTCLSNSSMDNLMDRCDELGLDVNEMFSTLLVSDSQGNLTTSSLVWSFFHKTLQEFLAALFIAHTITESDSNLDEIFIYSENAEKVSSLAKMKEKLDFKTKLSKTLTDRNVSLIHEDSSTVLSFVCGVLSEAGNVTKGRAKSILRVVEVICTPKRYNTPKGNSKSSSHHWKESEKHYAQAQARLIARILVETNGHPYIVAKVSHLQFTIKDITADDCYSVHPLLDHTDSTMDTYVTIEVSKRSTDLVDFVGESCRKLHHFKPKFKFTNLEDMKFTLAQLSQLELTKYKNNFSVGLAFYTDRFSVSTKKYQSTVIPPLPGISFHIQRNLKQIIATHENLEKEISDESALQTLKHLKYEIIGVVKTEHAVLVNWLLKNTHCRLDSFVTFEGSGVSNHTLEILKIGYNNIWYFQPRIRWLKSINEIHKLAEFLQQLGTSDHIQNDVILSISFANPFVSLATTGERPRPQGTTSISTLLVDHPELADDISKSKIRNNRKIIEYINEILPDQVGIANWLVRNTHCRLANNFIIHVEEVTQDILDLIEWEYEMWHVNPCFKFRNLSELLKGAECLVNYLEPRNKYKHDMNALVKVSFSAPTSLPANSVPPYPPPPKPDNIEEQEKEEVRRKKIKGSHNVRLIV